MFQFIGFIVILTFTVIGIVSALLVGFVLIRLLQGKMSQHNLFWFGFYFLADFSKGQANISIKKK